MKLQSSGRYLEGPLAGIPELWFGQTRLEKIVVVAPQALSYTRSSPSTSVLAPLTDAKQLENRVVWINQHFVLQLGANADVQISTFAADQHLELGASSANVRPCPLPPTPESRRAAIARYPPKMGLLNPAALQVSNLVGLKDWILGASSRRNLLRRLGVTEGCRRASTVNSEAWRSGGQRECR